MNRSIVCMKCCYAWRDVKLYTDERMKIIRGRLIEDTVCEGCVPDNILKAKTLVFCVSFWSITELNKYEPWESVFITNMQNVKVDSYKRGPGAFKNTNSSQTLPKPVCGDYPCLRP